MAFWNDRFKTLPEPKAERSWLDGQQIQTLPKTVLISFAQLKKTKYKRNCERWSNLRRLYLARLNGQSYLKWAAHATVSLFSFFKWISKTRATNSPACFKVVMGFGLAAAVCFTCWFQTVPLPVCSCLAWCDSTLPDGESTPLEISPACPVIQDRWVLQSACETHQDHHLMPYLCACES